VAECENPSVGITIVATDSDSTMLARAAAGLYRPSSLHDLPAELADRAFTTTGDRYEIRPDFRRNIVLLEQETRSQMPDGLFDLVLCRNLVFTYFDEASQRRLLAEICARLRAGGALVIGSKEALPEPHTDLVPWNGPTPVYRFAADRTA